MLEPPSASIGSTWGIARARPLVTTTVFAHSRCRPHAGIARGFHGDVRRLLPSLLFRPLRALHASGRERAAHALQRCVSVTVRNNSAIGPVSPKDALRCGASFATTAPLFLVLANRCSRPPLNPPSGTCLVHRCHLNPGPVQSSI
jgi:hypothetical protein